MNFQIGFYPIPAYLSSTENGLLKAGVIFCGSLLLIILISFNS